MVWTSTVEFDSLQFDLRLEKDSDYGPVSKFSTIPKEDQKGLQNGELAFYSVIIKQAELSFYFPGIILPNDEEDLAEDFNYLLERYLLPKFIRYLDSVKSNKLASWIK